ncbi:MAG TPA: hypothetical protein GXX19_05095 [Syntrophomonadaceae bacterium]|nr:hypothetical protein [Syntrophomonadaceae bacterium]
MKRLTVPALASLIALCLAAGSIAFFNYRLSNKADDGLLSLYDVTGAFKAGGLQLINGRVGRAELELGGVRPALFKIANTEDSLFVYIFKSIEDRKKVYDGPGYDPAGRNEVVRSLFSRYSPFPRLHEARNVLVVYTPEEIPMNDAENQIFRKVADAVFTGLNNGRTLIFKGSGTHWEAQLIYRYYEYWWKDSGGRWQYENWQTEHPVLKYKGKDLEDVGEISYTCMAPSGGMSGHTTLDQNGYAITGSGGSNVALTRKDDIYTVTVEWNGQKETFTLRAAP